MVPTAGPVQSTKVAQVKGNGKGKEKGLSYRLITKSDKTTVLRIAHSLKEHYGIGPDTKFWNRVAYQFSEQTSFPVHKNLGRSVKAWIKQRKEFLGGLKPGEDQNSSYHDAIDTWIRVEDARTTLKAKMNEPRSAEERAERMRQWRADQFRVYSEKTHIKLDARDFVSSSEDEDEVPQSPRENPSEILLKRFLAARERQKMDKTNAASGIDERTQRILRWRQDQVSTFTNETHTNPDARDFDSSSEDAVEVPQASREIPSKTPLKRSRVSTAATSGPGKKRQKKDRTNEPRSAEERAERIRQWRQDQFCTYSEKSHIKLDDRDFVSSSEDEVPQSPRENPSDILLKRFLAERERQKKDMDPLVESVQKSTEYLVQREANESNIKN
ncbi:hypothetical protein BP6252_10897 [Coleophoma cylindrospora]|uniref:Uncharacterized protein n=1 Tax=Coleophoma cylindrospora TaxID=1849047 RepID=A0A3D8QNI0_9HELO|nr:hypothetical protein BP6252_10897 [Coleophoma cylindrospora]